MPMYRWYPGETLREIMQRDDGFSHLRGLLRDLEALDGSCKRLRGEVQELLLKALGFGGSPDKSTLLLTSRHGTEPLGAVMEGRELRIPDLPREFSAGVDSWAELFEGRGVLVRKIALVLPRYSVEETDIRVSYEINGRLWERVTLWGDALERCLHRFRDLVTKLMREALAGLKRYQRELEELKGRILREYPKEILMGDL